MEIIVRKAEAVTAATRFRMANPDSNNWDLPEIVHLKAHIIQWALQEWLGQQPYLDERYPGGRHCRRFNNANPGGKDLGEGTYRRQTDFYFHGHHIDAKSMQTINGDEGEPNWIDLFASYRGETSDHAFWRINVHGWEFVGKLHENRSWKPHKNGRKGVGWDEIDLDRLRPPWEIWRLR